jgi:hypothetical protein
MGKYTGSTNCVTGPLPVSVIWRGYSTLSDGTKRVGG